MSVSRRRFLVAGVGGATALAAAGWLLWPAPGHAPGRVALDDDGAAVLAALVPALLDTALPMQPDLRTAALDDIVIGVDRAIAGLPPYAQGELAQLFSLLSLWPVRVALVHSTRPWNGIDAQSAARFLERLRTSRSMLLRSASPRSWTSIGYGGPPRLW